MSRTIKGDSCREREFFIDNLLVRIHFIIVMIWWTGLAPWELNSLFQVQLSLSVHVPCTIEGDSCTDRESLLNL